MGKVIHLGKKKIEKVTEEVYGSEEQYLKAGIADRDAAIAHINQLLETCSPDEKEKLEYHLMMVEGERYRFCDSLGGCRT